MRRVVLAVPAIGRSTKLSALVAVVIVCPALTFSACGGTTPAAPTPPPVQTSRASLYTVSGVVTERFSGRPVSGATVFIFPQQIPAGGWSARSVQSDANGRYQMAGVPAIGRTWAAATDAGDAFRYGYVQQCATVVNIQGDANVDLVVSSTADLTALNASAAATLDGRMVSGTVYARSSDGIKQPAANFWVGWEAAVDTVVAQTRTDSAGHYVLCWLPTAQIIGLFAAPAYGTVVYAMLAAGTDAILDFDLSRN